MTEPGPRRRLCDYPLHRRQGNGPEGLVVAQSEFALQGPGTLATAALGVDGSKKKWRTTRGTVHHLNLGRFRPKVLQHAGRHLQNVAVVGYDPFGVSLSTSPGRI